MIAVRLNGGLGNQLFQYSFGRGLNQQLNDDLYFYTIGQEKVTEPGPLTHFKLDIRYLHPDELGRYFVFPVNVLFQRFERKLLSLFPGINKNIYIETDRNFHKIRLGSVTCYDGYWQSYKYFSNICDQLKSEIIPVESVKIPSDLSDKMIQDESVSIHIRRGDYLSKSNKNIYWTCGGEYYRDAIRYLKTRIKNPIFFVFSDDIPWVKKNFTFLSESTTRFIEHGMTPTDCIDITLMRYCKHYIIANSTFGWWGAYLGNKNKNNIVIAPKKWYLKDHSFSIRDLIPPEWIII